MEYFDTEHFAKLAPQWNLNYFRKTDSTSAQARACCESGIAHSGDLFLTELQTGGVGRRGTSWSCPEGEGLLFTAVLETDLSAAYIGKLAIASGIAVADALEGFGVDAQLKWPNDVYIKGLKVSGILVEQIGTYSLFGIGVNTNVTDFPDDLNATSLKLNTSLEVKREQVLADILNKLIPLVSCCNNQFDLLVEKWKRHDFLLNKSICFKLDGKVQSGIARGLNADGLLMVETDSGTEAVASAEQISLQFGGERQ